jgi:agmatinase (EC 3.5.3.11)
MKILSIIYDGGSRIPGARFAPTKYYQEAMLYDRKDSDIITINLGNQDLFSIDLESLSRTIAESKVQIALGGDHSVTYLLAKATVREGAYLIVLDAHLDYFKDFESVVKNWNF